MCHCGEGTHSCRVKLNNIRGGRTLFGFLLKRLHQDRCPHRDIGGPGVRKEQHDHSAEVQPILSNASLQQGHEGIQGSRLEELAVIDDDNGILALCYRRTDVPNQAALKLAQPLHSAEGVYESRRGQPHNALAARVASEAVASLGQRFRQALGEPVLPKSNATLEGHNQRLGGLRAGDVRPHGLGDFPYGNMLAYHALLESLLQPAGWTPSAHDTGSTDDAIAGSPCTLRRGTSSIFARPHSRGPGARTADEQEGEQPHPRRPAAEAARLAQAKQQQRHRLRRHRCVSAPLPSAARDGGTARGPGELVS
mmetsp:Transcript_7362/g.27068  ORF Transcript_7362/g.27068 Transcript_7362/m.27068 type:complete len:309 (+) Transcript_7362:1647-2573(+)